jgi:hypothetical protein
MCHDKTRSLVRLRPRDHEGVGEMLLEQQRSRSDVARRAAELDERLAFLHGSRAIFAREFTVSFEGTELVIELLPR